MIKRYLLNLSLACYVLSATCYAEVPQLINYQGFLTDTLGDTVPDGNYSVTFRIYDVPAGGVPLWEEGRLVAVQGGLFAVILGSITPVSPTLFDQPERYLGVQVGLDPELAPRSRLVTMPYAGHAASADVATTSLDKTINASELTSGVLDTSRFSAYDDLLSEDRVGTSPVQIAVGDHIHLLSDISVFQDTSIVNLTLQNGVEQLAKSIIIPANTLGSFMKLYLRPQSSGSITWQIKIDQPVPNTVIAGSSQTAAASVSLNWAWFVQVDQSIQWATFQGVNLAFIKTFDLNTSQQINIDIWVQSLEVADISFSLGTVWLEYASK